ncbi:hypothetical protein ABE85_21980 [Mitsuaria sp. 7]|nr:hypothetical protein ABE85_21980 [Mitsuaria sp. 7]
MRRVAQAIVATLACTASGAWAQAVDTRFSVAILSNLAYPEPARGPWSRTGDPKADAEHFISQRVGAINRRSRDQPLLATFLNGNLTASGRDDQWTFIEGELKRLEMPALLALGDRDYQNQVDGCGPYECLHRNVDVLQRHLPADANLDLDVREYLNGTNVREQRGSLGWSVRRNGVHFVTVNLAPRHAARSSRYIWQKARTEIVELISPLPWLAQDLRKARAAGLPIVVLYPGGMDNASDPSFLTFMSLLEQYEVGALFMGGHAPEGGSPPPPGKIRTFFSSADSPQTHLYVAFTTRPGSGTSMKVERVQWNDEVKSDPSEASITLPTPVADIARDLREGMQEIRFVNNGGYVARFHVTYVDSSGREQRHASGSLSLGQTWTVRFRGIHASKATASAEVMTGLVWAPWHDIFRQEVGGDACFKVWGTSLSTSHGRC